MKQLYLVCAMALLTNAASAQDSVFEEAKNTLMSFMHVILAIYPIVVLLIFLWLKPRWPPIKAKSRPVIFCLLVLIVLSYLVAFLMTRQPCLICL